VTPTSPSTRSLSTIVKATTLVHIAKGEKRFRKGSSRESV
jgi:hypothetical protein